MKCGIQRRLRACIRKMERKCPMSTRTISILLCAGALATIFIMYLLQSPYPAGMRNNLFSPEEQREQDLRWKKKYHKPHVHKEDSLLGHTGELDDEAEHEHDVHTDSGRTSVAIGCAITTRHLTGLNDSYNLIPRIEVLRSFMPSFCQTASPGYAYHLYLSYDIDDPFFLEEGSHARFETKLFEIVAKSCHKGVNVTVHYVQCSHRGHPAWAQSEAMWEAYLDQRDYYFRINDDTIFLTVDWTKSFVFALEDANPSNVGVVGPKHRGGNEDILTYDFVHRTHLDIFGFYYPRLFTDWFADDWMTRVYQPDHALKLPNVRLIHTLQKGTRYEPNSELREQLRWQVERDQKTLNRYLKSLSHTIPIVTAASRIISMSLYGHDPKYTFGAIRNAQLVHIVFPGWKIRFYVEKPNERGEYAYGKVPSRILKTLKHLNAEIVEVDAQTRHLAPMLWRFLVGDDLNVDYFIVRDADGRLSERDLFAVNEWIKANTSFHCVRDHPSHAMHVFSGGLVGGQPRLLRQLFKDQKWSELMTNIRNKYLADITFFTNMIWPKVRTHTLCHDSISCQHWLDTNPFPIPREGSEHVGQVFDAFGTPRKEDIVILENADPNTQCGDVRKSSSDLDVLFGFLKQKIQSDSNFNEISKKLIPSEIEETVLSRQTRVVIWSMDTHISPIMDVKDLLQPVGVKFVDNSLAPNCQWTATCGTDLREVDASNVVEASPGLVHRFSEEYKNDREMQRVTHVLCMKPASICEFFMDYTNKSIIVLATGRYEEGRYLSDRWTEWNKNLISISKNRNNVVAANNKYDLEYMRFFTGLDPEYVPNYCGYVSASYSPQNKVFLLAPMINATFQVYFLKELNEAIVRKNVDIVVKPLRDVYPHYKFSHLAQHPGIIHVPHQVSMISMCEQYRMNIPLYFPSLDLLLSWHREYNVLRDRTFNHIRNRMGFKEDISPVAGVADVVHTPDPNDETEVGAMRYWVRFADYYQWPHVIHYESFESLVSHLQHTNGHSVSHSMQQFNKKLKEEILHKWSDILRKTL